MSHALSRNAGKPPASLRRGRQTCSDNGSAGSGCSAKPCSLQLTRRPGKAWSSICPPLCITTLLALHNRAPPGHLTQAAFGTVLLKVSIWILNWPRHHPAPHRTTPHRAEHGAGLPAPQVLQPTSPLTSAPGGKNVSALSGLSVHERKQMWQHCFLASPQGLALLFSRKLQRRVLRQIASPIQHSITQHNITPQQDTPQQDPPQHHTPQQDIHRSKTPHLNYFLAGGRIGAT